MNSVGRGEILAAAIFVLTGGVAMDIGWAASWREINIGLSSSVVNVEDIVIDPTNPSTIYARTRSAGAATSGIFKTTDGARNWRAISSLIGVNSIVIDPKNSSTIYALTGNGLRKSTNAGESWTGAGAGLPNSYVAALVIDPITPSNLYALIGTGIFKSTNGGGSWNPLNTGLPPNTYLSSLVIDPTTPSRIYATGSLPQSNGPPGSFILKTTDGGESWNVLDTGLPPNSSIGLLVIAPTTPSVIYALTTIPGNGPPRPAVAKSTDGGQSWTAINTGLPSGASVNSLVIDPKNSSIIYLVVIFPFAQAGGILKSTDAGVNWNAINTGLPANTPVRALAIDPVTSSTIYMIADGDLLKSTDGGSNWNKATTGLTTVNVRMLATNRIDPATVYTGAGDTVFKSVDNGGSWSKLFSFQLFASSIPNSIPSFFPDGAPTYPVSLLIDSANPNILYAETKRGNGCYYADNLLFKSADGGVSWSDRISPDKSGCVLGGLFGLSAGLKAIDPSDPNILYLAEADDEDEGWWLLKSKDGGVSWNSVGNFPVNVRAGVWALAIDPANSATLYAGLDDTPVYSELNNTSKPGMGGVFKSTDGGTTWNRIGLSGSAVKLLVIDPDRPSVLYGVTENNYGVPRGFKGVFKSTDSGANWSAINDGLASLLESGSSMTALVLDPADSNILYAGTAGGGVFKSTDGGASWIPLNDGLMNLDVRSLAIAPGSRHTLYAGTSGGVFRIIDDAP